MKNVSKLATVCLAVFAVAATPALAAGDANNVTATVAASPAEIASKARSANKKYCVNVMPDTSTRVARKVCRTKADWAAEDVDVDAKN